MDEVDYLLKKGNDSKRRAATEMNEKSSRSHTLFVIQVLQTCKKSGVCVTSKLNLVDLGGSESQKKSKATGERLVEAININQGLLALKNCVSALNEQRLHIPFNDSKLTMLLANSLGGNSKTSIIVTCTEETLHATETIQTLKFAELCSCVTTTTTNMVSSLQLALDQLNLQIKKTEEEILKYERWVTKKINRLDEVENTMEVVTTSGKLLDLT